MKPIRRRHATLLAKQHPHPTLQWYMSIITHLTHIIDGSGSTMPFRISITMSLSREWGSVMTSIEDFNNMMFSGEIIVEYPIITKITTNDSIYRTRRTPKYI